VRKSIQNRFTTPEINDFIIVDGIANGADRRSAAVKKRSPTISYEASRSAMTMKAAIDAEIAIMVIT